METGEIKSLSIVIFGAGNVATQLGKALNSQGHRIVQIVGRSETNAKELASAVGSEYTVDISKLNRKANLYILAVPDSAISELASSIDKLDGLVVHTSGSTPMIALERLSDEYGVFYPFQTFTKGREANLSGVSFCLEANSSEGYCVMFQLAKSLGGEPLEMNSKQREMLHLAGVFSCNFVNHMLAIAQQLAQESEFEFKLLEPLIVETVEKALQGDPLGSQTGPAVRGDSETIKKHIAQLSRIDDELRDLYLAISTSILNLKQANE
ncbi:Rossmann-like and DUF2520 domain-containing protein [Perlabentimonas gracilis]|uniref:Rossmann-like and DUF2520 domain-containing protein n=1 Tax=Perlabentimonas gracilis TaxID=2715279 RepID=UPI00140A9596|nr:Rossmann-like and DUF2520 domain-containing protein [Perlabentimonas gracilis]NHB68092.1 DUF2520 domain-containing protein [Perlabentimonas gracilis]